MSKELPEHIKREIEEDPYYFVYEGGSDGAFAHEVYLADYGKWEPEASKYAAKILKDTNRNW